MVNVEENKKIAVMVLIIILITLFIGYGISLKSTPESRKKKIISYLEKKYNSEFEIIELKDSGENIIMEEISCDRSTFFPKITDNGVYYYAYAVRSVSDNVTFEVKYLDRRLKDEITEITTYYSLTNKNDIISDIDNYIINTIGNYKVIIDLHFNFSKNSQIRISNFLRYFQDKLSNFQINLFKICKIKNPIIILDFLFFRVKLY